MKTKFTGRWIAFNVTTEWTLGYESSSNVVSFGSDNSYSKHSKS